MPAALLPGSWPLSLEDTSCPPKEIGGQLMYPASCPDTPSPTYTAIVLTIAGVVILIELVTGYVATRHRGRVSDRAWKVADVDRDGWLVWNLWHRLPFANLYYLVRLRPRLDRAERQLAKYGG